jgi:hypothetical protein
MLPREYTLSQYDSSPPLTACKIAVILIDSSFVEQVEEYTCLNTDSSKILVSNIKMVASLQVYSIGSRINLFCQARNER